MLLIAAGRGVDGRRPTEDLRRRRARVPRHHVRAAGAALRDAGGVARVARGAGAGAWVVHGEAAGGAGLGEGAGADGEQGSAGWDLLLWWEGLLLLLLLLLLLERRRLLLLLLWWWLGDAWTCGRFAL